MLLNFAMASLTSCTGVLMDVGVLLFRSTRLVLRPTRLWTVVWQMSPRLHIDVYAFEFILGRALHNLISHRWYS